MLSVHTNELTSGVGKFNAQLAERLGIPHASVGVSRLSYRYPLLSIKYGELEQMAGCRAYELSLPNQFDLLWHDAGEAKLTARATRTFYAKDTGCPSLVCGNVTRGTINVLTFGFAHKFQGVHFEQLKIWLDRTHEDYTVSLSTGIHEGTPWDVGFQQNIALMRGIFGDRLRVLGFLGDDALARELRDCTAVALFYEPAARANNTTLWAALDAGALVITNLDAESPSGLVHGMNVFNARQLNHWPTRDERAQWSRASARRIADHYGWDRLLDILAA